MSGERKKRIDIVSLKMVREKSILYSPRRINKPELAADLIRKFIADKDREVLIAIYLNMKKRANLFAGDKCGELSQFYRSPQRSI